MALKKSTDATRLHPVQPREPVRDAAGLLAQLGDTDAAVRRWAARDLAAHPQAAAAVCEHLGAEPDAAVRAVLFSTAARLGGATVVEGLLPLLRSEDPGLRSGAIEALSGLPDAVAPHIERLLQDADGDVRIFTVNLLGDLRHPRVPQWLGQVLLSDPSVNVVGAALDLLAEVGTPDSVPALHAVAQRFAGEAYIGFAVGLALERIGSP